MIVIRARNVHQALPEACYQLTRSEALAVEQPSRNGPVLRFTEPVTTVYEHPCERVLFWPERDANPFFHFFESLWMLAGRQDVGFVDQFSSNISQYSDDGKVFNAAYGYRWRKWFGHDQLALIAEALKRDPNCRRQVLTMWDGAHDLGLVSKDSPCNTHAYLQRGAAGELNLFVSNRSNDMIWGHYGANAVHFSFLLEYLANKIGCPVGKYWQTSANLHVYTKAHAELVRQMAFHAAQPPSKTFCPYSTSQVRSSRVDSDNPGFDDELHFLLESGTAAIGMSSRFIRRTAVPMFQAWNAWKNPKDGEDVLTRVTMANVYLQECESTDWALSCKEWLARRLEKWMQKNQVRSA